MQLSVTSLPEYIFLSTWSSSPLKCAHNLGEFELRVHSHSTVLSNKTNMEYRTFSEEECSESSKCFEMIARPVPEVCL